MNKCPFCGGSNITLGKSIRSDVKGDTIYQVWTKCGKCKARGPLELVKVKKGDKLLSEVDFKVLQLDASERWNSRR